MINEEIQKEWDDFVSYANDKGFTKYMGDLCYLSLKTGDALQLIGRRKVKLIKRNGEEIAEFSDIDNQENTKFQQIDHT